MDKDVRLPQGALQPLVSDPAHQKAAAALSFQTESSSSSSVSSQAKGGHVSEIDPSLLPANWPKHVKYLVDYEYHPSIPASVLNLVQGHLRKASERAQQQQQQQQQQQPPKDHTIEGIEFKNDENKEERSELEVEYDDIPLGHAIPGYLPPLPLSGRLGSVTPFISAVSAMDLSSSLLAAVNLSDPHPTIAFSPAVSNSGTETVVPASAATTTTTLNPLTTTTTSPPPYEIRLITGPPTHPVLGSYGLFATKLLRPGIHLLDYISLVVPDEYADPDSDHTLYLSNDLNLDASIHGNHGRFVNDFRGIRTQAQGPNVGWDLYRDTETGQVRMGCKVLKMIRRGEEIVCTYGKAYWKSRGVVATGEEWEDGWDTDLEDGAEVASDIDD
ncbi:hypothetical protein BGZ95_004959 [Linnemannia exigua]|uniref:SET domain-containing protein n=1 Tax=Linnemannia exigua TaxID=604196 RepID=A0AAD4HBG7_9FUNG|nr:hypothetical protein BGZ95_004959 [Linnemannia exigua]